MTREQLARRIADVSLLHGEFTLRSGRKSNYYLDKYRFETQPDVLLELGKLFAAKVSLAVQRIAGAELVRFPWPRPLPWPAANPSLSFATRKTTAPANWWKASSNPGTW